MQLYSKQIQTQTFSFGVLSNFFGQIFFEHFGAGVTASSSCDFSVYMFPRGSSKYLLLLLICSKNAFLYSVKLYIVFIIIINVEPYGDLVDQAFSQFNENSVIKTHIDKLEIIKHQRQNIPTKMIQKTHKNKKNFCNS